MRATPMIGVAIALAITMSSCGTDDAPETTLNPSSTSAASDEPGMTTPPSSGPKTAPPASAEPQGPIVEVTISGDRVDTPGTRVEAKAGEPVTFAITSDRSGELHVHSSPEQTPGFDIGQSDVQVTIERPGLIEVEEHESGELIVQLEVR